MRKLATPIALLALTLATSSHAGTAQENFLKLRGKYVAGPSMNLEDFNKPKALCVCDTSSLQVGMVWEDNNGLVGCGIPFYDAEGAFVGFIGACGEFEILAR